MFEVKYTTRFKKDYKRLKKRGYDMNKLLDVIDILREGNELPPEYKDHPTSRVPILCLSWVNEISRFFSLFCGSNFFIYFACIQKSESVLSASFLTNG